MTVDNESTPPAEHSQAGEAAPDPTALQRERDDYYDRLLRLTAEFDNYRKRTDRERRELSDYLTMDIVRDVLPVIDDLERAMAAPGAAATDNAELAAYHQGVTLIHRQLLEQLRKRGVEPMAVVGQPFDPEWHEAVADQPADGRPDGEITEEFRRGYRLGGRLVRAAMVKVAKA